MPAVTNQESYMYAMIRTGIALVGLLAVITGALGIDTDTAQSARFGAGVPPKKRKAPPSSKESSQKRNRVEQERDPSVNGTSGDNKDMEVEGLQTAYQGWQEFPGLLRNFLNSLDPEIDKGGEVMRVLNIPDNDQLTEMFNKLDAEIPQRTSTNSLTSSEPLPPLLEDPLLATNITTHTSTTNSADHEIIVIDSDSEEIEPEETQPVAMSEKFKIKNPKVNTQTPEDTQKTKSGEQDEKKLTQKEALEKHIRARLKASKGKAIEINIKDLRKAMRDYNSNWRVPENGLRALMTKLKKKFSITRTKDRTGYTIQEYRNNGD
jgi:hypothetical protein